MSFNSFSEDGQYLTQ